MTPEPPEPTDVPRVARSSAEDRIRESALRAGIGRVHVLTWRDLEHPDAGGSEVHVTAIASVWARAGLDVTVRTSSVRGLPATASRCGYRVVRKGGRWSVFLRSPAAEIVEAARRDALVEVWHGVNFLAPLWARGPRVGVAHHVHGDQFRAVLPAPVAGVASFLERHVYPRLYRSTPLVTLSRSGRDDLLALGYRPDLVTVASPGVDARFRPGGGRSPDPLVLGVGRLMPQKRFDLLVGLLVRLRARHPALRAVIAGEGPERARLESVVREAGAGGWLRLAGRVSDDELVDLYRRAWVLASPSTVEGWGMTITEAGACGTPAVARRIPGHVDAVVDGESGFLVDGDDEFLDRLDEVVSDDAVRERLGRRAREHAAGFTWESSAETVFEVLAADADRRASRG